MWSWPCEKCGRACQGGSDDSDGESGFPHKVMSALLPKADMCGATRDVRFGPIADIRKGILFDQIVSASEERRRNGESECLGGLEIDIFGPIADMAHLFNHLVGSIQ
jgi:hypothetical protein